MRNVLPRIQKRYKKHIKFRYIKKIFKEFKKEKLDALLLSTSETLLHKDYPEILKMAEEAEIMDQFLFTNGTLLNEKNSNLILKSSLTRLFISIDALLMRLMTKSIQ